MKLGCPSALGAGWQPEQINQIVSFRPSGRLQLAGFSVLFVVETVARHTMASDAAAPNVSNAIRSNERVAWLLAGLPLLRPGKGQGYRRATDLLTVEFTLSGSLDRFGRRPSEGLAIHPHTVHEHSQLASDGNLRFL
jgi:hypothetical protein